MHANVLLFMFRSICISLCRCVAGFQMLQFFTHNVYLAVFKIDPLEEELLGLSYSSLLTGAPPGQPPSLNLSSDSTSFVFLQNLSVNVM